jgi:hypothetical protein
VGRGSAWASFMGLFCGTLLSLAAKSKSHKVPRPRARSKEYTTAQLQLLSLCSTYSLAIFRCTAAYLLTGRHYTLLQLIILIVSYQLCPSTGFNIQLLLLVTNNQPCNRHKPCPPPHHRPPPFFSHQLRRKCRLQFHPLLRRHQVKLPNLVDLCDEEGCAIGNGFFLMGLPVSGDNNTAATRSMRDDRKRMFESPPSSSSKRTVTLYPRPLKKLKKASLLE